MIPPLTRRCPSCDYRGLTRRFAAVAGDRQLVECPVCGYRFERVENPWLK